MEKQIEGKVEKIVAGGLGLVRTIEGVVFASDVLPGEIIRFSLPSGSGKMKIAEDVIRIRDSEHRISPPCPYYGDCGGCDLMHTPADVQINIKKEILIESLSRIGKFESLDLPDIELWQGRVLGYRTRIQLHLNREGVGFRKRGSTQILPIKNCIVSSPALQGFIGSLHTELNPDWIDFIDLDTSSQYQVQVLDTNTGSMPLTALLEQNRPGLRKESDLAERFRDSHLLNDKTGEVRVGSSFITVDSAGFFQSNHEGLLAMLGSIQGFMKYIPSATKVLELYCGIGVIGSSLPESVQSVTGVEVDRESVYQAQINYGKRGVAICSSVKDFLFSKRGMQVLEDADILIADPSRRGLDGMLIQKLKTMKRGPGWLILIFCDPVSAARDISLICAQGFCIELIKLFDFYPQTSHFETLVILRKDPQ